MIQYKLINFNENGDIKMAGILTAIWAIIIFSVIIFVHEFGHFITAKSFGVLVHEFAIGMGPAIFKKQKGETLYSIRAIPIGGYCKMEGEENDSDNPRAFSKKTKLQRLIILASGALMNLILGFVLIVGLMSQNVSSGFATLTVGEVLENSPAYEAGIQVGDKIIGVDGKNVSSSDEYRMYRKSDKEALLKIKRDGEKLEIKVPSKEYKYDTKTGEIVDISSEREFPTVWLMGITFKTESGNVINILKHSFKKLKFFSLMILNSLGEIITGKIGAENLSGPVGIVNEISTAAKSGFLEIIFLAALITINLGLFNLLPFPALDGGRILFIIIEAIIRKPVPAKYEGAFHFVGFALLILLMIYATGNDITRIFAR